MSSNGCQRITTEAYHTYVCQVPYINLKGNSAMLNSIQKWKESISTQSNVVVAWIRRCEDGKANGAMKDTEGHEANADRPMNPATWPYAVMFPLQCTVPFTFHTDVALMQTITQISIPSAILRGNLSHVVQVSFCFPVRPLNVTEFSSSLIFRRKFADQTPNQNACFNMRIIACQYLIRS